jgi:hypothetical protein
VPLDKTTGAFFYCGGANRGKSLYNIGYTHKWTSGNQADGFTYCVARKSSTPTSFTYKKMKMYRTAVGASVTNSNIRKACAKRGMRPVCDHANYFDGLCVLANERWHFSHPSHDKRYGIDVNIVKGAFFYTSNGERTLQNQVTRHRWTSNGKFPVSGDTFCAQESSVDRDFVYKKYFKLKRLRVDGTMTSANILKACTGAKMKPLCDHQAYSDGKCELLGGSWHFSHPSHNRRFKVPVTNVKGSFFYCGKSNHGKSLLNTGTTHRWTTGKEKNGYTFCVSRLPEFPREFTFNGFKLSRTQFNGAATSSNILLACNKRRMVPVCEHSNYANGECQMVGSRFSNWHISHGARAVSHKLDQDKLSGAYFYTANANGNRALQQYENGHRWTTSNDQGGGDTFCTTPQHVKSFTKGNYTLISVKVSGAMTSPNIKKACNDKGMQPVCDHASYADGNCVPVGGKWHFSYPVDNIRNKVPVSAVMNTYWYTSNPNQKSMWNRGDTHLWKPDARKDANGYTFCTKEAATEPPLAVVSRTEPPLTLQHQTKDTQSSGRWGTPTLRLPPRIPSMPPRIPTMPPHKGPCKNAGHLHMDFGGDMRKFGDKEQHQLHSYIANALSMKRQDLKVTRHLVDEFGLNHGAVGHGHIFHPTKVNINFRFVGTDAIKHGYELERKVEQGTFKLTGILSPFPLLRLEMEEIYCTSTPTSGPTSTHTARPTVTPTEKPTAKPTVKPTNAPTAVPTTAKPTVKPTLTPTEEPSAVPTVTPTEKPTASPTAQPTNAPSMPPTSEPTFEPSVSPTKLPSNKPTMTPTEVPTTLPPTTDKPSFAPSHTPTEDPTAVPSAVPTDEPTIKPTAKPTTDPTQQPTTQEPTAVPTEEPTVEPTPTPTEKPTAKPTQVPSQEPTYEPTVEPTQPPTTLPPTESPTDEPSSAPTVAPTHVPSELPTHAPTKPPTGCLVRGAKMHILFRARSSRRLLMAVHAQMALLPADAAALEAALATELKLNVNELTMHQFAESSGLVHTEFLFHNKNAIRLGRDLEQKVMQNKFHPLPNQPIHRLYLEEVFDCGAHAVGATHTRDQSNNGPITWTLPDSGYGASNLFKKKK